MNTSNGLETLGFLYISPPASARCRAEQAPAILKSTAKDFFITRAMRFRGFGQGVRH